MESPSSGAAEKAKFHDGRLKPYPHEELGTPNDVRILRRSSLCCLLLLLFSLLAVVVLLSSRSSTCNVQQRESMLCILMLWWNLVFCENVILLRVP